VAKLRTVEEFSTAIAADFTWRIREISDLKSIVRRSDAVFVDTILRASVPLLYAHWEGHVSAVAKAYLQYIARRKLDYASLKMNFRLNEFFSDLDRLSRSQMSYTEKLAILDKIVCSGSVRMRRVDDQVVSTRSNLNSAILIDICNYLSLDRQQFQSDFDFIDKILLHRRNSIAHGERTAITVGAFEELAERVIALMRRFNNLVENDVVEERYKISPKP
jgi:hypothetical protein